MSEGKKVLVVTDDLDRMILEDQLKAAGFDAEVIVDRSAAGKIVGALLTLPTKRDEMMKIIGQTGYTGPYNQAAMGLSSRIKEEIRKFTSIYPASIGLCDKLMNLVREELILPTELTKAINGGDLSGVEESMREASLSFEVTTKDMVPPLLLDILKELKGIKEVVTPVREVEHNQAVTDFLAQPGLFISDLIEGLRFLEKNPDTIKKHMETFQDTPGDIKHVAYYLDHFHPNSESFKPEQLFQHLLDGLENGTADIRFLGFNALNEDNKAMLRQELNRALGKQRAKVAGGTKRTFLEGLIRALLGTKEPGDHILIDGIGALSEAESNELITLFAGVVKNSTSGRYTVSDFSHVTGSYGKAILTQLIDEFATPVSHISLKGLDGMDSGVQRNLQAALKSALCKFEELEQVRKDFVAHGQRKNPNTSYILHALATQWVAAAGECGVKIDGMKLLNYLLQEQVNKIDGGKDDPKRSVFLESVLSDARPLNWLALEQKFPEGIPTGLIIGNHMFDCTKREDGSVKVTTNYGDNNSNNLIISKDGSIKLENPGYLG